MTAESEADVEHSLESTWVLQAPLGQVWDNLCDPLCWPDWWPAIEQVERLKAGKSHGVEALYRVNGEELRVCEVRPMERLECHTTQALARWTLEYEEGHTFIHLSVWGCRDNAAFAKAMSAGARGLAEHLKVRLLEVGSWDAATDQTLFP
ncbi:hypothetical protein [uncultured Meiothermus sp.]|jgi:uncharacterized protein YndB with AHSA1/START domain|uniref:hypothetical protein n=1 Tax=uncultured Meiothermus sp. TaxID=157471 RepID=UPI002611AAB1|nr:hypothetical protein [uncultured Meiothermus sp.]